MYNDCYFLPFRIIIFIVCSICENTFNNVNIFSFFVVTAVWLSWLQPFINARNSVLQSEIIEIVHKTEDWNCIILNDDDVS